MKQKLSNVRAQMRLTQEQLATLADVSRTIIYYGETRKKPIGRISAYAILKVLNGLRQDHSLPALDIDDLDWRISGEG